MKKDYMKFIILLLITFPVFACQISIPISEAQRYIDAMPNGVAPLYSCKDKPEEDCMCADLIEWEAAEIVNEIIDGDPIWSEKKKIQECSSVEACEDLRFDHCESLKDGYQFFYSENIIIPGFDAYCSKITGYKKVENGKKTLANSKSKKLQREAIALTERVAREQKIEKKKQARDTLKNYDGSKVKTIAELRSVVEQLIEVLKEP